MILLLEDCNDCKRDIWHRNAIYIVEDKLTIQNHDDDNKKNTILLTIATTTRTPRTTKNKTENENENLALASLPACPVDCCLLKYILASWPVLPNACHYKLLFIPPPYALFFALTLLLHWFALLSLQDEEMKVMRYQTTPNICLDGSGWLALAGWLRLAGSDWMALAGSGWLTHPKL
uniref:Uncharacterized protein n=1 Tax=Glossina brevipalpis TaxID=37001 RepID=A0A1A9WD93_9MUSC